MTTPIGPANSSPSSTYSNASQSSSSSSGLNSLTQPNTFLNLLVDEIKYQNPLNPSNSTDFMAQLAQLSQVEQLNNVSTSMQISEAASLIGKTVTGNDSSGASVTGTVSAVTNGTNGPLLEVNGSTVGLSSITKIGG